MTAAKVELRAEILAARRAVPAHEHDADAHALLGHATTLISAGETVCAYVPVGSEPGSLALIDSLHRRGVRVLLPVARHDTAGVPQPLQWGGYVPGELAEGRFGLREPKGPWLAPEVVARATTLLIPALAVDRSGVRLGRGAGFYDRSLRWVSRSARLVAVVRDDELVDRLPAEPHDVSMTHALTPQRGLLALDAPGPGMTNAT
ncbi:5-formyltetrahydrofolate cyclo-ligase [Mycobacterium sp. 852002-51961_SCH5331710]|uniref:5-formyltetrahydrofolate cyclo-ligase n=1 Tax=Mycobacterium sp. 852002-51961_SCH5331710 TaxID=1834105 RepID=UPI00080228CC|nr:5-formyltetrahydrofolate cyclo-ligase [Mycobacterium sp. 852002-51961_SCH5331710]OBB39928.1 5-formyltetrahydrofolate cyclo-ligase [Mycobacterium sp. 852002-51961_SCH5331710]